MHEYSRDLQFLRSCVFFFLKCFSWFCVALLFPRHATILAVHTYIHTASSSRRGGMTAWFSCQFWAAALLTAVAITWTPLTHVAPSALFSCCCSAAPADDLRVQQQRQGARTRIILYPTRLKWVHSRQLMYKERKTVQQRVSVWWWCCCCCCFVVNESTRLLCYSPH